jgi:hypothetical protein
MVINDFNIEGLVALEPETHAPLAVDAYAPLALAVARQLFQLVGWRQAQILDARGSVKLAQTHGRPFQISVGNRRDLPVAKNCSVSGLAKV